MSRKRQQPPQPAAERLTSLRCSSGENVSTSDSQNEPDETKHAHERNTSWTRMVLALPLELAAVSSRTDNFYLRKRKRKQWWSVGHFPKVQLCVCSSHASKVYVQFCLEQRCFLQTMLKYAVHDNLGDSFPYSCLTCSLTIHAFDEHKTLLAASNLLLSTLQKLQHLWGYIFAVIAAVLTQGCVLPLGSMPLVHILTQSTATVLSGTSRASGRCRAARAAHHHLAEAATLGAHLLLRFLQPDHSPEPEGCNHGDSGRRRNPTLAGILLRSARFPSILHDLWLACHPPAPQRSLLRCCRSPRPLLHLLCHSLVPSLCMASSTRHVQ